MHSNRNNIIKSKRELTLPDVLNLIYFNVGSIIHLEQVKPVSHHYSVEVITGNLMVVTNKTTGEEKIVNLNEFKKEFGGCSWERIEAIVSY